MRRSLSILWVATALTFFGCNTTNENKIDPINDPFEKEQEDIKKLLVEIFETAKAKDMVALDAYHLNSPKFSKFDDGDVPQLQDYAMAKKTEEEFFTSISQFNYTLPEVKVDVFDDMAITSFILDYSVVLGEETFTGKSRSTLVFVKDGDGWKIVHEHFSPFIQPAD